MNYLRVNTVAPMALKALYVLKQNIRALLVARGQTQQDLARGCDRSDSWISQILTHPQRGFQIQDLDRIGRFFGLEAYELFLPGLSAHTERRQGLERRAGGDRRRGRVGERLEPLPSFAELEQQIRRLNPDEYRTFLRRATAALALGEPTRSDTSRHGPADEDPPRAVPRARNPRGR